MATSYFGDRASSPVVDGGASVLSPTTPTSAAPRSNALQNRITGVLSASYADLEIRDALTILDTRGLQNTAEARRNLRLDVQQELIECNGKIVQDFGKVAEQLKRIGTAIANLNDSCAEMRKHISAANRETRPMLDEAKSILAEKQQVETKRQLLTAFTAHFVVSDSDLSTLTSTAEPVNDDFFRVLTRVRKIHSDSQVLLGTENQRLGLEILEQSSRHLNSQRSRSCTAGYSASSRRSTSRTRSSAPRSAARFTRASRAARRCSRTAWTSSRKRGSTSSPTTSTRRSQGLQ